MGKKDKQQVIPAATMPVAKVALTTATTTTVEATEGTVPTEPVLKVDFKKAFEYLRSRSFRELPVDFKFKTAGEKELNLHDAYSVILKTVCPEKPTKVIAISRNRWLNLFCINNQLKPTDSKRTNKEENKSLTMYGVVPLYADGFEVDGDNYPILGWLKHPVFRVDDVAVVKYGIHMLVMPQVEYEKLVKGQLLEDAVISIVA